MKQRPNLLQLLVMIGFMLSLAAVSFAEEKARIVRLKPNDAVRMEVFGQDDLATQTRIMKSGEVVFPLIGTVMVGGLTVSEAIEEVRSLYAAKYLVDPKVLITVDEYAGEFVTVIGAVNGAGQIPIPANGRMDLSTAIAGAGGLSPTADRNKIVLTRSDGSASTYSAAQLENKTTVPMKSGDRIVVHQSQFVNKSVTILGRVRKPGPVPLPLNGKLDIVNAIAQAGGVDELANSKKIKINRSGEVILLDLREMTENGDRRFFLKADDIVTVPERWF